MDFSIYLAAAATVTKAVDFIRNAADPKATAPKWIWNLLAFGFGIVIAYTSSLAIYTGSWGQVVTGIAIGAAASGFHEVFDFFSAHAKKAGK